MKPSKEQANTNKAHERSKRELSELLKLIEQTDTETGDNLKELYKEIISAWKALNE